MTNIAKDTKVQLELMTDSKRRVFLDCYVESSEVDRLILRFPPSGSEFESLLGEGSVIKVFVYTYTGIWILHSMVIEPPQEGLITVEFKEEHQVIQRRKYFRIFTQNDFFVNVDSKKVKTVTRDISGGGVRFETAQTLKQGDIYNAELMIYNPEQKISVTGRILKKNPQRPEEYVLEYTNIAERDREKIISYCIWLERQKHKKY